MQINLEIAVELKKKVMSNSSVNAIWKQTVSTMYKAYRAGLMSQDEYQAEYNATLYRCSLMAS